MPPRGSHSKSERSVHGVGILFRLLFIIVCASMLWLLAFHFSGYSQPFVDHPLVKSMEAKFLHRYIPPPPPATPPPTNTPTIQPTVTITPTFAPTKQTPSRKKAPKSPPKKSKPPTTASISTTTGNGKPKKKPKRYAGLQVLNVDPDWAANGEYPWIEVLPTKKKIPIKKDRRVVFRNVSFEPFERTAGPRSAHLGHSRDLLYAEAKLQQHLFFLEPHLADGSTPLELAMVRLYEHCKRPVFLGMATVHDDLYWQLIENFFYSSVRFGVEQCTLLICVSDPQCLAMCASAYFPCFNFTSSERKVSVMEQIAQVKLLLVPRALSLGVSIFMLDLDVGFLQNPQHLLAPFEETKVVDIMVQEDMIFIMNRSTVGWKSWFTEPLPNIGLFLVRGNNRTSRVFEISWEKYVDMDDDNEKRQPGKDQNHVLDAMRIGRGIFALKYAYYDATTAPLLDKLVLRYGTVLELGGQVLAGVLQRQGAIAVHATCYEQSTKVHGLRAAGAFWNPKRYDPWQRTITKFIIYQNEHQLIEEVRSLVYLAMVSGRKLILPNLLGDPNPRNTDSRRYPDVARVALYDPETEQPLYAPDSLGPGQWATSLDMLSSDSTPPRLGLNPQILDEAQWQTAINRKGSAKGPAQRLWPGFRVVYLKRTRGRNDLNVELLEPNFYWRVRRDYDDPENISFLWYTPQEEEDLLVVRDRLLSAEYRDQARIVLAADHRLHSPKHREQWTQWLTQWAEDSVGAFPIPYHEVLRQYEPLPSVKQVRNLRREDTAHSKLVTDILQGLRLCNNVFHPSTSNRTCFQVCD